MGCRHFTCLLGLLVCLGETVGGCASTAPSEPPADIFWPASPPPPILSPDDPNRASMRPDERARHHRPERRSAPEAEEEPIPEINAAAIPVPTALAQSTLLLGLAMYNSLAQEPGNIVLSPYDLLRVLAMAHAGANQRSADELANVINLPVGPRELFAGIRSVSDSLDASTELHEGNAVVIAQDTGLSAQMKTKLAEAFGPHLEHEAISDMTHGAESFLAQDDSHLQSTDRAAADSWKSLGLESSRLALLGTTTYQGNWQENAVNPRRRHYGYRFRDGRMHDIHTFAPGGPTSYFETEEFRALQFPLAAGRFALLLLRPKQVKATLSFAPNANDLQYIIDHLTPTAVDIQVPAFYVNSTHSLTATVRALGAQSLFDSSRSELSNLGPAGVGLYARDVLHGVAMQVNEKGAKLHAFTALKFNGEATRVSRKRGIDNLETPFMFVLRDTTWGMPVAMGRIETL